MASEDDERRLTTNGVTMNPSSWYYARNQERHVRQIVIKLSTESITSARVGNPTADPAFIAPNWAVTVVLDSTATAPVIFAKATGAMDLVDNKPADVVFAFYHLDHGGVFQIFVQVDSSELRSKFGYPFVAEHARWLDETDDLRIIEALVANDKIELCFVAPGEQGPYTGFFCLTGTVPSDCRERLLQEWDELQKHHGLIEFRNFQSALEQYNQENPMEMSPILPPSEPQNAPDQELSPETLGAVLQALSSDDVKEGAILEFQRDATVVGDQGGLGLTDHDIVELYNHGIRKVGEIELTPGVYEMAQMASEMGTERQLSDFAADLIKQKEQKKKRTQKKPEANVKPERPYLERTLSPLDTWRLILIPVLISLSLNLFGLFVYQWSRSIYMSVNGGLIVVVGVYSAFRLERAGAWPPEKTTTQNPGEELGGCIAGLFVIGIVLSILGGALKLSNTIMLPIVLVSVAIYALFQLAVYPRLFKALVLFALISKLPEVVGSFSFPTGMQDSPVRTSNILAMSLTMPVYATWVGMIAAAVLYWRRDRRGEVTLSTMSAGATDERNTDVSDDKARNLYQQGIKNADRQNWKEAARDFTAAVELDRTSPTYVYSLAVARTQCAPADVGEEELQKYYLDVCALFEKAISLDTTRSELDREAYKKVAFTCGALYRSLQKHEDALRLFSIGLKHHSNDTQLLAGVGWSQFDLGQISDAEKTVSQLLEVAPDSNDGRQLWKSVQKAHGRDLAADLSEDLKRQIYAEYLEKRDRSFVQGYMDSGVSAKLSFEELVADMSGKAGDAHLKVRRLLLEKYRLKEFEFDLILKQGEREAWGAD